MVQAGRACSLRDRRGFRKEDPSASLRRRHGRRSPDGAPGVDSGLVPSRYVAALVGGNSLFANFIASVVGAFMYFATLTEIPILQGLLGAGMGQGPALALLLAGPALSLPSMLVINSVLGPKKTAAYAALVVVMATISGMIFGAIVA